MKDSHAAIVALAVSGIIAAIAWAARRSSSPAPDTRVDTSSFGPVEHVGPIGNTSGTLPIAGRPGEVPNLDVVPLPAIFSGYGCSNRSVGDFHPDCLGDTWTAFQEGAIPHLAGAADWVRTGVAKRIHVAGDPPSHIVKGALLDPRLTWYAIDYRAVAQQ